eukprot:378566-Rhodomonas_salina.1
MGDMRAVNCTQPAAVLGRHDDRTWKSTRLDHQCRYHRLSPIITDYRSPEHRFIFRSHDDHPRSARVVTRWVLGGFVLSTVVIPCRLARQLRRSYPLMPELLCVFVVVGSVPPEHQPLSLFRKVHVHVRVACTHAMPASANKTQMPKSKELSEHRKRNTQVQSKVSAERVGEGYESAAGAIPDPPVRTRELAEAGGVVVFQAASSTARRRSRQSRAPPHSTG